MKRLIIAMLMLACTGVWAQDVVRDSVAVADTTDAEENVIGGRVDTSYTRRHEHKKKEQNVIGTPIYYGLDGQERRGGLRPSELRRPQSAPEPYNRPKHHYQNSLTDRYCGFFAEVESMLGPRDLALGMNMTYLPRRWGAYGSILAGLNHSYLSVGPALRLSGYDSSYDWHLYGGAIFGGRHIGGEFGLRLALPQNDSDFCWTSASMGMAIINGDSYLTLGLSLELSLVCALTTLLFW